VIAALAFVAGLLAGAMLTAWIVLVFTVLAMRTERRQRDEQAQQRRQGFRDA
jgi:hypothetical protein